MSGGEPPAPLLLAVECATQHASVALLRGERLLAQVSSVLERPASEILLPALDALFDLAGAGRDALGAFAVSIGPGSFTGLRVGLATVKALALGTARPVAAVSTLEALALAAGSPERPVSALLDARRGEVYAGAWVRGAPGLAEGLYGIEALAGALPQGCTLVGEGALLHEAALRRMRPDLAGILPEPQALAVQVGMLGRRQLAAGGGADAAGLVPRYLRRAEAEARRTGQRLEGPARGVAGAVFDTPGGLP